MMLSPRSLIAASRISCQLIGLCILSILVFDFVSMFLSWSTSSSDTSFESSSEFLLLLFYVETFCFGQGSLTVVSQDVFQRFLGQIIVPTPVCSLFTSVLTGYCLFQRLVSRFHRLAFLVIQFYFQVLEFQILEDAVIDRCYATSSRVLACVLTLIYFLPYLLPTRRFGFFYRLHLSPFFLCSTLVWLFQIVEDAFAL